MEIFCTNHIHKLSKRLQIIYNALPESVTRLIDVGCDHGRLGVAALQTGKADRILAIDIATKPLDKAKKLFNKVQLNDRVEFMLTNGLVDVQTRKGDVVVIAGMGGLEIKDILTFSKPKLACVERVILHPTKSAWQLRQKLCDLQLVIVDEYLCIEAERYYCIMILEPKSSVANYDLSPVEAFFGPMILKKWQLADFKQVKPEIAIQDKLNQSAATSAAKISGTHTLQEQTFVFENQKVNRNFDRELYAGYLHNRLQLLKAYQKDPHKQELCKEIETAFFKNYNF